MRNQLVLCCRSRAPHHSASRSAHRPQSRRGCAPVSAPSQRGPRADVNGSLTLCVGAHDCVLGRGRVHAASCMPVHACPCAHTVHDIAHANTRVRRRRRRRRRVGRRRRRSRCRRRRGRVGRSRSRRRRRRRSRPACATSLFYVAAHVRPTIPPVAAHIGLSPGADVDQYRRSPSVVPELM